MVHYLDYPSALGLEHAEVRPPLDETTSEEGPPGEDPGGPKEASHGRNPPSDPDPAGTDRDAAAIARPGRVAHPPAIAHPRRIAAAARIATDGDERVIPAVRPSARLPTGLPAAGLPAELTRSLVSLWTQYAGKPPSGARTEVRGNVITCVLIDSVGDYNAGLIEAQRQNLENPASGASRRTDAAYKSEAAATVTDLTGRRVTSFISSHDRDTNVATETFTLEARVHRGRGIVEDGLIAPHTAPKTSLTETQSERTGMPKQITADQVVAAAEDLDKAEFTRGDIAQKLGVDKPKKFRPGFRQARQAGRLDKVRDDEEGTGHFRLTDR